MPIEYEVISEVVDIRNDTPIGGDVFFVDSNIWYWIAYSRPSSGDNPPAKYQLSSYSSYINKILNTELNQPKLYFCDFSLAELAHLIEQTEYEIYNRMASSEIKKKEYRHKCPAERSKVIKEIKTAWGQVEKLAKSIGIDSLSTQSVLSRIANQPIDGYDSFIIECVIKGGIAKILTDDSDYVSTPGMQIFTANKNVIESAKNQNRLVVR